MQGNHLLVLNILYFVLFFLKKIVVIFFVTKLFKQMKIDKNKKMAVRQIWLIVSSWSYVRTPEFV